MDAMVSARVPVEIKRQGDRKLKEMGSSATELINSAYRYVLAYGTLPTAQAAQPASAPQMKTLTGDAAEDFRQQWKARAVLEARGYDGSNFKEKLDEARGEYYARFA